jgi:excinuclease ABC subunit A
VLHVLAPLDGLRTAFSEGAAKHEGIGKVEVFLHAARLPGLRDQLSRAGSAPVLLQQQATAGCPDCVGTGVKLTASSARRLDDTLLAAEEKGREQTFAEVEVEDVSDEACPGCHGSRLNMQARAVRFDKTGIADIAALSCATCAAGWRACRCATC